MEPFDTTKGSYNVLLLPFQPLEECQYKKTDIENTIITRLRDLNERDTLNLQVKYDTLDCIHNSDEATALGRKLRADLVIWGDLYEHCSNDTNEACLKFVNISTGKKQESGIEKMASLSEVKDGKLQKDLDYIIYWVQGSRAYAKENYQKALTLFNHLEVLHKYNKELIFTMGLCNQYLRKYEVAKKHYERVLNLDSNDFASHTNYATILSYNNKNLEGAKKHYEKALDLKPDDSVTQGMYALFLERKLHDIEGAKKHYEKALELNPYDKKVLNNYANFIQGNFNDYAGAKKHYEKALELDSEYILAHHNYAKLLFDINDYAGAKKHYEKVLTLNPNNASAHYGYAFLLEEKYNSYSDAKVHYEKALEIKPDNVYDYALVQVNYAYLLDVRYNSHEDAIKHYKKALEIYPNEAKIQLDYTVSLKNDDKPAGEILKHYKIAIQLDPTLKTPERDKLFGL